MLCKPRINKPADEIWHPMSWGAINPGESITKGSFFQSFNWIQSEPGSKTPVTSMRLPAGSGTWLIHAYRFILCCQVLCVFSTGCHHDLVFFWFEAWHSAAAREAFML